MSVTAAVATVIALAGAVVALVFLPARPGGEQVEDPAEGVAEELAPAA